MKKILGIFIFILCLTSCATKGTTTNISNGDIKVKYVTDPISTWNITEITYEGETHQYIVHDGVYAKNIVHWEGCKYCKEKNH